MSSFYRSVAVASVIAIASCAHVAQRTTPRTIVAPQRVAPELSGILHTISTTHADSARLEVLSRRF